jgi:hypothetical protein
MRFPAGLAARCAIVISVSLGIASTARAQAGLSTQGFGFPTGQMSTRTLGTGGSLAEIDPLSPVNPASISLLGTRIIFFQIEPEFRTVKSNGGSDATRTVRYPNVFGAIPVSSNFVFSLGSSTLLDRTSETLFRQSQVLSPGDSVGMTTRFTVNGAMNDVRLAGAWTPVGWLRVGVGAHAITGHNLITVQQSFDDTVAFAISSQQRIFSFSGTAASAGVQLISKYLTAALSARQGGTLTMSAEDTTLSRARVPNRFGGSLTYTGLAGSFFSVRTAHDNWSALGGLGSATLKGVDGWDTSVGADVSGPRIGSRPLFVRGGFRDRTLPFTADGNNVTEKSVSAGLGTLFANGRVLSDLAVIRATRSAGLSASEKAWTISIGLSVRP